jgi:hypothetical protein
MKLHSVLLGWTGFLTKSCVSPQVFHGSMPLPGVSESELAKLAQPVEIAGQPASRGHLAWLLQQRSESELSAPADQYERKI